jgi:hypothetical protein
LGGKKRGMPYWREVDLNIWTRRRGEGEGEERKEGMMKALVFTFLK